MNTLLTQMLAHADPSQVAGLARFFKKHWLNVKRKTKTFARNRKRKKAQK